jgi:hypothetical protein
MSDPVNITLSAPIMAHGQTVTALTIAPPKAGDIRATGMPINVRTGDINAESMVQLLARLSAVPPSSINEISAGDFIACVGAIMGFLSPPSSEPTP